MFFFQNALHLIYLFAPHHFLSPSVEFVIAHFGPSEEDFAWNPPWILEFGVWVKLKQSNSHQMNYFDFFINMYIYIYVYIYLKNHHEHPSSKKKKR